MINKKVLVLSALIVLTTNSAFALDNAYYLTIGGGPLMSSTVKPTINSSSIINKGDTAPIFFLGGGYNFNKHFRIEIPFVLSSPQYKSSIQKRLINGELLNESASIKTSFVGVIVNGYGSYEINERAEAFVGAGLGGGYLNYKFTQVIEGKKGKHIFTNTTKSKNQLQFAWNLSTGIGFKIDDASKIDVKYQYINLGKINKYAKNSNSNSISTGLKKSIAISGHAITVGFRRYL